MLKVSYLNYGHPSGWGLAGISPLSGEAGVAARVPLRNSQAVGGRFEVHHLRPGRAEGQASLVVEVHGGRGQGGAAHHVHDVHGVPLLHLALHQHDIVFVDLLLLALAPAQLRVAVLGDAAVVGADLLVLALALDRDGDHGREQDDGDSAQSHDERQRHVPVMLLPVHAGHPLGQGAAHRADDELGHRGQGGLAVVSHLHDQLHDGSHVLPEGVQRADLAAGRIYFKQVVIVAVHDLVGEAPALAEVAVQGAHGAHQVAQAGVARHLQLGRVVLQRGQHDHRRVVVHVQHCHPHGGIALQVRGRPRVLSQHLELKSLGLLVVKGAQGVDGPVGGVHGHVGVDGHVADVRGQDGVGHRAVLAQVGVLGEHRAQVLSWDVVLMHLQHVESLGETRWVVILIQNLDGERLGGIEGRGAPVPRHDGHVVLVLCLPVQRAVSHDRVEVIVVLLQLEGHRSSRPAQAAGRPTSAQDPALQLPVLTRVAVSDPHEGDDGAWRGGLTQRPLAHGDETDGRRVVVAVDELDSDLAVGRDGVGTQVSSLHVDLQHAVLLIVQVAFDTDQAGLGVDGEELPHAVGHVAAEGVEHFAIGAFVGVRGIQVDDHGAHRGVLGQFHQVGGRLEDGAVVVGVDHLHVDLHRGGARRLPAIQGGQHERVVVLLLAVQRLLDHQLWELGAVTPGLDVQREETMVVAGEQIGAEPVLARVGVVRAGEGEAGAGGRVLRDVHLDLVGREGGRIVVDVLDLHLDHADLLVVGEHLEGQLALGVVAAQGLAVDALLGVEEPAVRVHVQQVRRRVLQHPVAAGLAAPAAAALCGRNPRLQPRIFADVADHRAGPLLLRHGVVQVFERQGRGPEQKTATDGKVHPRPVGWRQ